MSLSYQDQNFCQLRLNEIKVKKYVPRKYA